jgi:flagellar capping protein FliD
MSTAATGVISGSIKWTGLASGTDFGSVVEQLVAIEQRTITRQETWKAEWQEKITAISGLNTRLVSLKLDAQDKDIRSELLTRSTTISNESVLSVVNTSTASLGSYEITVAEKVQEKYASKSYSSTGIIEIDTASGAILGDTVTITVGDKDNGGKEYVFTTAAWSATAAAGLIRTGAGSSLRTIMEDINETVAADGLLKASVLDDKEVGGVLQQRLLLTSTNAGSEYRITVKDKATTLGLGKTNIVDPVYTTFKGSDAVIEVMDSTAYTGAVNKTFTFVASNTGVLGEDEISIMWADTEGHSGKFVVTQLDEVVDVYQGLQIKFTKGGTGRFIANESFTI